MTTLTVTVQASGKQVGQITLADDGTVQTTGLGRAILDQISRGRGWDDKKTIETLADGGWSNGYMTVKAIEA